MKTSLFFVLILVIFLGACTTVQNTQTNQQSAEDQEWKNTQLKNIRTGDNFKISDFDKPVLIESFAVWCPACTRQQEFTKALHEELGDSFVSISLDTDPNEDEKIVLDHINANGFDWYYAISPTEMTQSLIDEFGPIIVNAPAVPMVLICNGESKLLGRGLKLVDNLKSELKACGV